MHIALAGRMFDPRQYREKRSELGDGSPQVRLVQSLARAAEWPLDEHQVVYAAMQLGVVLG
jgi:hypothetical protein